jgi:HisJ family histidinol phosphate phosphatase
MSEQTMTDDPRIAAVPDIHGHAKGEHKLFVDERPIPYTARMLFLWFFHACRRGAPRFLMVADHINYLTFEDPAAVNLVRRALKLAQAGDLYGAAETAGVDVQHAAVVGEGLRRGMRYSIGAEVDNDPRSRPDAQNIVDAMRPDGIVRSVHFLAIKHPQFGENWMWPFDNPEFRDVYDIVGTEQTWELYMATLIDAIEKLPGHIVGHFYVPAKFGHWPSDEVLEAYEDRLLDACAERGMAVEINSRYYYKHAIDDPAQLEKYSAANLRLLRKAKEKGVLVAVGSDAHSPKDQGRGFGDVLALLDLAELNEIAFPIDGRIARVALRATEELRQASSKAARDERPLAVPIPGTEDPEAADEEDVESGRTPERAGSVAESAAPVAPKKRPSRAKKPRQAEPEPSDAGRAEEPAVLATAASEETASDEAGSESPAQASPATAVVEALASVAKHMAQKIVATLIRPDQGTADEPNTALPAASAEPATEAEAPEPGSPAKLASSEATSEDRSESEAVAAAAIPLPVENARPRTAARPASATSVVKRPAKPPAKVVRRGKPVAKKAAASKAAPAAKKRVVKKAAPSAAKKTARPSRSSGAVAKKVAAKKAVPARKATKAAPVKTASRSSAKKATSKKTTAKKKATKSRR